MGEWVGGWGNRRAGQKKFSPKVSGGFSVSASARIVKLCNACKRRGAPDSQIDLEDVSEHCGGTKNF